MTHDPLCPWHGYEKTSCRDSETLITFCEVIAKVREDMLDRCEEAAYTDLLALEDDFREALGKGSDAARIVARYRSAMPGFRKFYEGQS